MSIKFSTSKRQRDYQRLYQRSEKGKAVARKFRQSEKGKAAARRYNQSRKRKKWVSKWWKSDKGKAARGRHNWKLKLQVMSHYCRKAPQCMCPGCPVKIIELLELHHINGGGKAHRKITGFGTKFYRWLRHRGFPKGYKVLCANCHKARHRNCDCGH